MNSINLFAGINVGQFVLNEIGIKGKSYSSEICKHANYASSINFPDVIQLGDIHNINVGDLPFIDLVMGGSPCQSLSGLGDGSGLSGKSGLFFQYVRILKEIHAYNPKVKFLLENVRPRKKEWADQISEILGVGYVEINSNLFVPQSRTRYYWTNIEFELPVKQNELSLKDLLDSTVEDKYLMGEGWLKWWNENKEFQIKKQYSSLDADQALCLTARMYSSWNGNFITTDKGIRRLTPGECLKLQGMPRDFLSMLKDNHAYSAIGNGWTMHPIKHILSNLNK
jgi:site-specific DNA-cytosine methylase